MSHQVAFVCQHCGGKAVRGNGSARYCLACSVSRNKKRMQTERSKALAKARQCADTPEARRELMRAWGFE